MVEVRLQKHIANLGYCSRRKAEELISIGKVIVNGKVVKKMGIKVDPKKDKIEVDKKEIGNLKPNCPEGGLKTRNTNLYIMLNKPVGYITSTSSEQGTSVLDLITIDNYTKKPIDTRVYPVGRLDKDSEGLVLLTNDGELTDKLTHPRYEHEKEYEVTVDKHLSKDAIKILEKGMGIGKDIVRGIKIIKQFNKGKRTIVTAILKEGKNRQIRRMFGQLGYNITALKRIRMNKLKLGVLPVGKWKFVKKSDIL